MKITINQLKRIIKEEVAKATAKYNVGDYVAIMTADGYSDTEEIGKITEMDEENGGCEAEIWTEDPDSDMEGEFLIPAAVGLSPDSGYGSSHITRKATRAEIKSYNASVKMWKQENE